MNQFFNHTIFLNDGEKKQLSDHISDHINQVLSDISEHHIIANVYLTGSMARQEPSVRFDKNGYTLNSDIDFIIVVSPKCKNTDWLMTITNYLNKRYPNYHDSVIVVSKQAIDNFISCIGKDLEIGFRNPLFESFSVSKNKIIQITKDDLFDCVVHQCTCYYLNATSISNTSLNKDINYSYIKMLLECLRVQLYDTGYEYIGYYDVFLQANRLSNQCDISVDVIISLLKSRELFGKVSPPEINTSDLILCTIANLFSLPQINILEENVLSFLIQRAEKSDTFLKKFQCATVLFALSIEVNPLYKDIFLKESYFILYSIRNFIPKSLMLDEWNKGDISNKFYCVKNLLISLKKVYLEHLTIKDTGESGFSDIN